MNLKEILNEAMAQSAFLQRDVWAAGQDTEQVQMVAFANKAADEIRTFYNWGRMRQTYPITLTTALAYPLPPDFKTYIPKTMWRNNSVRVVTIPTDNATWGYLKAANPGSAYQYYAQFRGGNLEFISVTPGDVITFDYIGTMAIKSSGGALKPRFSQDTDTFILNDDTLVMGVQYYWKIEKEIATAGQAGKDYYSALRADVGDDTGAVELSGDEPVFIGPVAAQYQL